MDTSLARFKTYKQNPKFRALWEQMKAEARRAPPDALNAASGVPNAGNDQICDFLDLPLERPDRQAVY
jgi:hypothetical protein